MANSKHVLLRWQIHPFRQYPLRGFWTLVFLFFLLLYLEASGESMALIVTVALFFFFALAPFFLPTKYFLREEEIVISCFFTQREPWHKWKRVVDLQEGFLLSPFPQASPLDNWRGIFLRVPPELREEVAKVLHKKIPTSTSCCEKESKGGASST